MHTQLALSVLIVTATAASSQVVFNSQLLPKGSGPALKYFTNDRSGLYSGLHAGYVSINADYLTITNGAQCWDFTEGPTNFIETVSVINAADLDPELVKDIPGITHVLSYQQNEPDPGPSVEFYTKMTVGTGTILDSRLAPIRRLFLKVTTWTYSVLLPTARPGRARPSIPIRPVAF